MFRVIRDFEEYWGWFNRQSSTSEQILSWADELRIICIEDHRADHGFAYYRNNKRHIFFNPHLPEAEKILVLGHELGHQLLGHTYRSPINNFSRSSLFERTGFEKDASIIGYLCMIPSQTIFRLISEGRADPEALYNEYLPLWSDLDEDYSFAICQARMRIFDALMAACCRRGTRGSKYLKSQFGYIALGQ